MQFIKSHKYILLAGVVIAIFFTLMQFLPSKGFSDPDGYYHAGAAKLIAQHKLGPSFPWAYFSTLRERFGDQHYVYHLLLIPFSSIEGMHVSVVIFSTLSVIVFMLLLRSIGVKYAAAWGIFSLVSSIDFLFRINVVKANTLSLILLFGAIWLFAKKKFIWLLPLTALFVWTYGGFVFMPMIAGMYSVSFVIAHWKVASWKELAWSFRPVVYVLAGIGLGLVLHPHFSNIAVHLYYQIFDTGLGAGLTIPVGGEWNPYGPYELFASNGLALMAFIISSAFMIVSISGLSANPEQEKKPLDKTFSLFLWFVSVAFLLFAVRSRRFVEYAAPFMVLFSAYMSSQFLLRGGRNAIRKAWDDHIARYFFILIIFVITMVAMYNVVRVADWLRDSTPPEVLRGSSEWLAQNTEPGTIIFNTKWDDLPQLFYWNSQNYYIIGLDPTFLYVYNHDLYWDWRKIADNDPTKFDSSYSTMKDLLQNKFDSSYILLEDKRDRKLKTFLENSQEDGAEQMYDDGYASIYKIN